MKVALLASASSIHTIRWVNGLAQFGLDVHLITQHPILEVVDGRVAVTEFPNRGSMGYFFAVPKVRRLLRRLRPDVLSAHYASGYGTTARLSGYHPWMLSVWGSDVYDVPERSLVHRWWVRANLKAADRIASTSRCMAKQTRSIAPVRGKIEITPFGVDVEAFAKRSSSLDDRAEGGPIVVGTVKTLAPKYGVDILIRSFAYVRTELQSTAPGAAERLRLRIVGDGPDEALLKDLSAELGVGGVTQFIGRVPHDEVAAELEKLDMYVGLSRFDSESFGVAIIEAGAARRPVVVSNAGGLPEVVVPEVTGLVVPRNDPVAAAGAIKRLVEHPELRTKMGEAGLAHVSGRYSWSASIRAMVNALEKTRHIAESGDSTN